LKKAQPEVAANSTPGNFLGLKMIEEPRDRGFANPNTFFQQSGPQLLQRDVRLLTHQPPDLFLVGFQNVRLMPPNLSGLTLRVARERLTSLVTVLRLTS
jgi:hypothetical protein